MTLPTVLTWLYFVRLAEAPTAVQQGVYAAGKTLQFALPIAFITLVLRKRLRGNSLSRRGLVEGLVSGLVACLGAFALTALLEAQNPALVAQAGARIGAKVTGLGIATLPRFVAVAIFYSLIHSALEEYYWRWFVYGQLRRFLRVRPAIWLGALAFMAHHVVLIGFFTGWNWTESLSLAVLVGIGGGYWAWLYERSGSLIGPWAGHLLVDAVLFAVGWDLITRG